MNHPDDTIAAIVTAPGESGVAIVRLSGPDSHEIAKKAFTSPSSREAADLKPGRFLYGWIRDDQGVDLDEVLLLVMKAPHSFTGEDVIEIQGHGGTWSARKILRRVIDLGAKPAEAGEFSRRAFLNGRIDLLQAEAVADVIHAQSERAQTAALEQLEGGLSQKFDDVYESLILLAADIEATLDFVEEELPGQVMDDLLSRLQKIIARMDELLASWHEGHLLRDGALIVLAGKPNSGKSTLLNHFMEKDRAIVSDIPGTTRDTIEELVILDGIPVRMVDTAGIREARDTIEQEGISRTQTALSQADLILYLVDSTTGLDHEDFNHISPHKKKQIGIIYNKTDLGPTPKEAETFNAPTLSISLKTGQGLDLLREFLVSQLAGESNLSARPHAVISERHKTLLIDARNELSQALEGLNKDREDSVPLISLHLRDALECLGQVTGKEYSEALLDNIFARFCVGK